MASRLKTEGAQTSMELHSHVSILKDLEDLIAPTFGPCGRQVLISTGSGSCMICKDGKMILDSYVTSNPITNWVVGRVRGHYKLSGDNSKSFILLFNELLRRVEGCHRRERIQSDGTWELSCQEIARGVARLASDALPTVLMSSVLGSDVLFSANLPYNSEDLGEFVDSMILSTLQGNLPQDVSKHLGRLALDFIQLHLPLHELRERIHFITGNFSYLCQEVSGHSVTDSHIVDGILIPRDFAFCADNLDRCANDGIDLRVLLIACDFVTEHTPSNTTILLSSVDQVAQAAMSNEQMWSKFITRLQDYDVGALITVNIVPDPLLAKCRRSNISVIHSVCPDELSSSSERSGLPMMYELGEALDSLIHNVAFMRRTILGKKVYSHVGFRTEAGQMLRHLVICSPTATISKSYSTSVQNALRSLHHCLDTPVKLNSELDGPLQGIDGESLPAKGGSKSRERSEPVLNYQATHQAELRGVHGNLEHDQCGEEGDVRLHGVYGGGAIEQIMSNALHRFSKQSRDEQLRLASRVFAEALEIIPRTLHNNSYQVNMRGFLEGKARTVQERDGCLGINSRSGAWVPAAELGVVEPLGSKLALWQSVLQSMHELLRIDAIIGVSESENGE